MGYNARNDEIHENIERMRREREAYEDSLAIVRQFNARLSAKKTAWFWPTVAAALASKHHWLIIACDACNTVIDLDLTVKRRDPDKPIRIALNDVRCPHCNGHGRTRIVGLSRYPSVWTRRSLMRLYMFEHCSLCFRVRMIAALKGIHLQETVVLDDDSDTMVALVGKRQIPILVKDDGVPMLESMKMVEHIDGIGKPILTGPDHPEVADWANRATQKTAPLTWPRYPLLGLPEFATVAAHDHYAMRKRDTLGDLAEHRAKTSEYLRELTPHLEQLDGLIESSQAINGQLSMDDIRVLPLLRSAAVVKGLRFPDKVTSYFETMMARIGYQSLPAI